MGSKKIKILGIIPARGESKSIKNKNLIRINSKTLIENCYKIAKLSTYFTKIVCSSDSKKILDLCKRKKIPFVKRPKRFSTSKSNVIYAAKHIIKHEKKFNKNYDFIALIQPTSIFLRVKDIKNCVELLSKNKKLNSLQTIHKTPHNYNFINTRIIKNKSLKFKFKNQRLKKYNKQLKEITYSFGNIYFTRVKNLIKENNFFCEPMGYIQIDKISSFDLDEKLDYLIAKKISKINFNKIN